ncbi:MAG: 4-hydroxy-tetrahydrodipicolinate reductase [Actinomycetota bacterium]
MGDQVIRVAVLGAGGRMGSEVCRAVKDDPDMELVAAVEPNPGGDTGITDPGTTLTAIDELKDKSVDVAVDFTNSASVAGNVEWCLNHSVHVVVGTTGISEQEMDGFEELAQSSSANVLVAPNFAIGAVLMMYFAKLAAAWMDSAEIIELHHQGKLDSPSGTAIKTAEAIIAGRMEDVQHETENAGELKQTLAGARGAELDGVRIHSLRLPGLVAHQEVIFGGEGQTLSIRHDTTDRTSFMPGVLLAIREVSKHRGLTRGLDELLHLR